MNLPKQIEICFLPTLSAGRSHLYEHTLDGNYMGKGGEGGDYLSTSNNQVSESGNLETCTAGPETFRLYSFSLHISMEKSPQRRKFNEDESCKIR